MKHFAGWAKRGSHARFPPLAIRDGWLWHYRFDHLYFRDIGNLKKKNMVSRLLKIQIPSEVYEEYVQDKQHKK